MFISVSFGGSFGYIVLRMEERVEGKDEPIRRGSRVGNEKGGRGGVFGFIKTLGGAGALSLCG